MSLKKKLQINNVIEAWTYDTDIYKGISIGVFDKKRGNSQSVVSVESVDYSDGIENRVVIHKAEAEKNNFRIVVEETEGNQSLIAEIAYELYKQDWIDNNTTPEIRLETLRKYSKYIKDCIVNDLEVESFEEWVLENGYAGVGVYACYEEFCSNEYQYVEDMCDLLDDAELAELYFESIDDEF